MASEPMSEAPLSERHRPYKRLGTNRIRTELQTDALEAVRKALRQGSYETLTIEQVAAITGISRRSLYNLFIDKNDMFTQSCQRLIAAVSAIVIDDIPEDMAPVDGLRFYVASCVEVYESVDARDLLLTILRDGARHPWLAQAYRRKVRDPLVRTLEMFVLKNTRRTPVDVHVPRYIAEHILHVVKLQAITPMMFHHEFVPRSLCTNQQELLAQVYASIWLVGKADLTA